MNCRNRRNRQAILSLRQCPETNWVFIQIGWLDWHLEWVIALTCTMWNTQSPTLSAVNSRTKGVRCEKESSSLSKKIASIWTLCENLLFCYIWVYYWILIYGEREIHLHTHTYLMWKSLGIDFASFFDPCGEYVDSTYSLLLT